MTHFPGLRAALESCQASRWTLLMARIFGQRQTTTDEFGTVIKTAHWRGKTYLLDFEKENAA